MRTNSTKTNATYNGQRVHADRDMGDGAVVIHGNGWAAMVAESDIIRDSDR